jgi:hypothetical protein
MDGSFDPSETGSGDSNERNVEIKSELSASSILLATNNETTTTTKTKEALTTSTPNSSILALESNSTLTHATGSSTSINSLVQPTLYQIYQDLDEQPRVVTQSPSNQDVIIDRNSHYLLPSTSREDQPSPKIRYIDENSLYDITKLKGSDGKYKKGSNGEIYTAKWSENENRSVLVAIKVEDGTKTEKEGKVYCEAEKLSDLKHEHIIEFYGVVPKLDSVDWVVMELGDCSLKEFLNDLRRLLNSLEDYDLRDILPYRQCVEYFLQIVRAMKEAHSKVKKVFFF